MGEHEGTSLNATAADWLARLQRHGGISAAERNEFERWLDADPANAVAFARAEFTWERAERLRAVRTQAFSAEAVAAESQVDARRLSTPARAWAVAASFAVVAVGMALVYWISQANVYATAVGERRTISLADGSQLTLNTASKLEVDMTAEHRSVRLVRGEALFKVAKDPSRPFTVEARGSEVRAIGTAFNVRVREEVVEVTVTEGVVSVDESRIAAGSSAIAGAGTVSEIPLDQDVLRRRVAWREGAIELKGETIEQAVAEFNRYRQMPIVVADPSIAALRVGGRFETDDGERFLNALSQNFAVRVVRAENGSLYLFGGRE